MKLRPTTAGPETVTGDNTQDHTKKGPDTMTNDYIIKESDIPDSIRAAAAAGYRAYIIINGQLYDVQPEPPKTGK